MVKLLTFSVARSKHHNVLSKVISKLGVAADCSDVASIRAYKKRK